MQTVHIKPKFYRLAQIVGDSKKETFGLLPISRATWLRGVKSGIYPQSVSLGARSVAWSANEIDTLVEKIESGEFGCNSNLD